MSGRYQSNFMAKLPDLASPVMRGAHASIATTHLGNSEKKAKQ